MEVKSKKVKVVMLPTTKPANKLFEVTANHGYEMHHLYFLSDEEIKGGDWVTNSKLLHKVDVLLDGYIGIYKIIATTDPSLNLPKPSKAFIRKYVKLGGIDEVMVEYTRDLEYMQLNIDSQGKISSWQLKVNYNNEITIHPVKDCWNREEIKTMLVEFNEVMAKNYHWFMPACEDMINNFIKQNL